MFLIERTMWAFISGNRVNDRNRAHDGSPELDGVFVDGERKGRGDTNLERRTDNALDRRIHQYYAENDR